MNYRQGDVFLVKLGAQKGTEPGKNRPAIVVQTDALNETSHPTCIVVLCSSKKMPLTSIRPLIVEPFFEKDTFALADQVRSIDVSKRFLKKIGALSDENLTLLLNALKRLVE